MTAYVGLPSRVSLCECERIMPYTFIPIIHTLRPVFAL